MILLVTAGRGPIECRESVAALAPRLAAICAARGVPILDTRVDGDPPGSVAFTLGEAGGLADLLGTHCVIAKSDRRGRRARQRWFVGVSLHPAPPPAAPLDPRDVEFTATTARGPGGQHVNKTASAVRARHRPSGTVVTVQDQRSQHANRALALVRLADALGQQAADAAAQALAQRWAAHDALKRGDPVKTWRF